MMEIAKVVQFLQTLIGLEPAISDSVRRALAAIAAHDHNTRIVLALVFPDHHTDVDAEIDKQLDQLPE